MLFLHFELLWEENMTLKLLDGNVQILFHHSFVVNKKIYILQFQVVFFTTVLLWIE